MYYGIVKTVNSTWKNFHHLFACLCSVEGYKAKIAQFCMLKSISDQNVKFSANASIVRFSTHVVFTKSLLNTYALCSMHEKP